MKKRYKVLIFIFLILLIGLAFLFRYRVAIVSQIVPIIKNDTIHIAINNDTAFVHTTLYAQNKTFIPTKIDSLKYRIALFNKVYIHQETYLGIALEGHGKDTFDISMKIPITEVLEDLDEVRKKTENANYSIDIAIQYSTIFGRVDLPVNKTAKFKIPTPPEIKIEKVNYNKIRLKYALAEVKVKVINFNPISLTINSLDYKLTIPNHGYAVGKYSEPILIKPRSEIYIYLPVEILWTHLGKALNDILSDDDIYNYELNCLAVVSMSSEEKPILIEVTRPGKMELRREVPKDKSDKDRNKDSRKKRQKKHDKNRDKNK